MAGDGASCLLCQCREQHVVAVVASFGAGAGDTHWSRHFSTVLDQDLIFGDGAGAETSPTDRTGGERALAPADPWW